MSRKSALSYPGVYVWKNKVNGKVYVGSSISLRRRKAEHILRLNKGCEGNEYFQRAWAKYGPDAFEFSVLEQCLIVDRLEREQHWMDHFKSTDERFGYNLIQTRKSQLYGESLSKHQKAGWAKYTPEERKRMNLHLNNPKNHAIILAKSNEVKKLPAWRKSMEEGAWAKLRRRWDDPIEAAKIVAAQNEGRRRAKERKLADQRRDSPNNGEVKPLKCRIKSRHRERLIAQ